MSALRWVLGLLSILSLLALFDCRTQTEAVPHDDVKRDQVLPLTFGGFLKDGPESERVEGMCGLDYTRSLLNCDLYNGLPGWVITEVTLNVTWSPYGDDDIRYFRVPISIKPLTKEHTTVRLGLTLPPDEVSKIGRSVLTSRHWGWQNVGAKGYPAK